MPKHLLLGEAISRLILRAPCHSVKHHIPTKYFRLSIGSFPVAATGHGIPRNPEIARWSGFRLSKHRESRLCLKPGIR